MKNCPVLDQLNAVKSDPGTWIPIVHEVREVLLILKIEVLNYNTFMEI